MKPSFLLLCAALAGSSFAASFRVEEGALTLEVTCLTPRSVQVAAWPKGTPPPASRVLPAAGEVADVSVSGTTLRTPFISVAYDAAEQALTFCDTATGRVILSEKKRSLTPASIPGESTTSFETAQTFSIPSGEAFYGLGQFQDGSFNWRGRTLTLQQTNRIIVNPVLLSTGGYALYWDNPSKTRFSDSPEGTEFRSDFGDAIRYCFVYGPSMKEAVAEFRALTGAAPLFPKAAFGFWMSKERYTSFDELDSVTAEFRRRGIPLDVIVQDWRYWGTDNALWNSLSFNPAHFAEPEKRIAALHDERRVRLALSVWPGVGTKTAIYRELEEIGALFNLPTWAGYKVIDFTNPKAREIFWKHLKTGLYDKGVDFWWMDATEPSFKEGNLDAEARKAGPGAAGTLLRNLNAYSLPVCETMYRGLREAGEKRVCLLTRSAFAGQQKYAAAVWSGDIYASWRVFRNQIPAGLNLCMTGIPYWTTDIGGFFVTRAEKDDGGYKNPLKNPDYLELYTRWFQYAVFTPLFRAHGTNIPREPWRFGEPGTPYYDAQIDAINLRYSLLSYIYSHAWHVTSRHATLMRPAITDFPEDAALREDASCFMFGDALFVAPVTRPLPGGVLPVYLPGHSGKIWYDLHSPVWHEGGKSIDAPAPISRTPVFVKGGSILPRDLPGGATSIGIYTGSDAFFELYEDDGETYAYERGIYSSITFTWNETTRTLTLSAPQGGMPPLQARRTFAITLFQPGPEGAVSENTLQITYENKPLTLRFDRWFGATRAHTTLSGCPVRLTFPAKAREGNPWCWTLEFPDAFTQRCAAPALIGEGFAHAYISVGNTFGSPKAIEQMKALYDWMVAQGYSKKPVLIGLSRGGLYAYRFAATYPDCVGVIYGDAPVCDFKSWPGGKGKGKGSPGDWKNLITLYGFANEAEALAWKGNPIDSLAPLAARGIPLIHVVGDVDDVVPADENTGLIESRYRALGGTIEVIHKPGVGHHPHGLSDPRPVVDFILKKRL